MKKLNNQPFDPPEEFKVKCELNSIRQYAKDYSLTAKQIGEIFSEGIIVCSRVGKIQIPNYSDNDLLILDKQ